MTPPQNITPQEKRLREQAKAEGVSPGKIVAENYAKQCERRRQKNQNGNIFKFTASMKAARKKIFGPKETPQEISEEAEPLPF